MDLREEVLERLARLNDKGRSKYEVLCTDELVESVDAVIDLEIRRTLNSTTAYEPVVDSIGLVVRDFAYGLIGKYEVITANSDKSITGNTMSWRGNYEYLAVMLEDTDEPVHVKDFLDVDDTYTGWKGGDYYLTSLSTLRVSESYDDWLDVRIYHAVIDKESKTVKLYIVNMESNAEVFKMKLHLSYVNGKKRMKEIKRKLRNLIS